MPKGYWVVRANVLNKEKYSKYIEKATAAVDLFGGRFLVRGGTQTEFENHGYDRSVVVEFNSYKAALACYRSSQYQNALKYIGESAERLFAVVEGL